MVRVVSLAIIAALSFATAPAAGRDPVSPKRAVSLNLCADQLLLALADPEQIAAVGPLARKRSISYLGQRAAAIPSVRGGAEELFRLQTDLVLLGSYDRPFVRQMLARRKVPYLELKPWADIQSGLAQIRLVASKLGQAQRGAKLAADIRAALTTLKRLARDKKSARTFLLVQRRGYVMQSGITLDLLHMAGLKDLSPQLRLGAASIASIEDIIHYRPDLLVVESLNEKPSDQGQAKLLHPALRKLYPLAKRLEIPERLTVCPGPSTPALINHLADEIARKVH
ncbi:MAG: ABC transporter substrate-binding protein [Hyphomicrobiales bacterium]|nr:ABC transporter substrate-binding protein [Hyphomicrobiales bacterium]